MVATLVGTLCLAGGPRALAATHVVQGLTATTHAPGRANPVLQTASHGRLRVSARGLTRSASFDLVIGGIKVASFTTTPGGSGKVKLGTTPHGAMGLLGTDPRGQTIAVRDDQGNDDLEGDMPDDDQGGTDVACCLPGDNGSECEDETAADCSAAGGTAPGATSCIPDPCGATGGGSPVVCCIANSAAGAFVDDDPEVECEDGGSAADCANAGGTVVQATSCDPNPCAPVPPPQIVTCCVPDSEETECEELTPDHCTAAGGTVNSATSCDPDPCTASTTTTTEPSGDIQCCRPNDGGTECDEESPAECAADQGVNMGAGTCDPNPCTP